MATRNDNCTTCGGFGFTIEHNGYEEFMTGCRECSVAAQEADDFGAQVDRIVVSWDGTFIDVRMP